MSGIRGSWNLSHFVEKCSCGVIISQCRCPAPDKVVRIVQQGCEDCKKKASK